MRFVLALILILLYTAVPVMAQCDANADYMELGQQQLNRRDLQGALNSYTCQIQLRPGYAPAYQMRGNTYRDMGQYNNAIADYTQVITLRGDYAPAYNNRGWAYYKLTDYDRALADYNLAIATDATYAYAYNNRGLIYQLRGDDGRASADYLKAMELGIDTDWSNYNFNTISGDTLLEDAFTAYDQRDFETAVQAFSQIIVRSPDNLDIYLLRAHSNTALNRFEDALADYQHVIEQRPDFAFGYWGRAVAYAGMGQLDEARADAQKAASLDSSHINNLITQGAIETFAGNESDAADAFFRLMASYTRSRVPSGELIPGVTIKFEIEEGQVFVFIVDGQEGQKLTVRTESIDTDPLVVILNPDGMAVTGDDDGGTGFNALIDSFELSTSGTYVILVSHAGSGDDGFIDVTMTLE